MPGISERREESSSASASELGESFHYSSEDAAEQQSDTSSLRDASVLLDHYYTDESCQPYKDMMQRQEQMLQDYDDYTQSLRVLEHGISATKYNYCNESSREITIRIAEDHSGLLYRSKEQGMFGPL